MRATDTVSTQKIVLILFTGILLFWGCGSTQEIATENTTMPVILDGRILYTDTTIVEDQIVNVKLDPGPDTLRVGSGYFNIGVLQLGRYSLLLLPQNRRFDIPPATIVLLDGLNVYDFMIPRHEEGEVSEGGVDQDTLIYIPGMRRIE